MRPISTFSVSPSIPEKLKHLEEIAYNLRWSWDDDTIQLFIRLDRDLWEKTGHNPVLILSMVGQEKLDEVAEDESYIAHYHSVLEKLRNYKKNSGTWFGKKHGKEEKPLIAYFSAEFGITESLPIYSGGLGMLAGDHLKSASELGLPLVGVGLLYQQGYFRQYLNEDGWQQESYPENDFYNMPITLEKNKNGEPYIIEVKYPGRVVKARIWRAQVGRVQLFLLDTNFDANPQEDQDIVDQLYGGDNEMRMKQEIMLGIGGLKALKAMGYDPDVCHMNEGHSAFLGLERIRSLMKEKGFTFDEARSATVAGNIFTTHTPVEAGHDFFEATLVNKYFENYRKELGLEEKEFLALGRSDRNNADELFSMTILAAYLSSGRNGVSKLHGEVTRQMWAKYWPNIPAHEIPVSHVTNGVHPSSWLSKEIEYLFDRYLGPRWINRADDQSVWEAVADIPAVELWNTHKLRRQRLIAYARRKLRAQLERRGASALEIERSDEVLDPSVLTIGFARRFATYKRGYLLFRDEERLVNILNNPEHPVQLIFAGKAHPRDHAGKEIIRKIVHYAHRNDLRNKIVFLEDYDMDVARYLVKGVDVWLNTPVRPREASGTSGMKAAFNGALNLSILDGWWEEAYKPSLGWAIGRGEDYNNQELQDEIESNALNEILENDVIPTFYDRGRDGIPRKWITMMKESMAAVCPYFNTNRMVQEYTDKHYMPSFERLKEVTAADYTEAKKLAAWKKRIREYWMNVKIVETRLEENGNLLVGDGLKVSTEIYLDRLKPEDVRVDLYWGKLDTKQNFTEPTANEMELVKGPDDSKYLFRAENVPIDTSGLHGYTVRIKPKYSLLDKMYQFEMLDIMKWAGR